jgi:hypothetical protein
VILDHQPGPTARRYSATTAGQQQRQHHYDDRAGPSFTIDQVTSTGTEKTLVILCQMPLVLRHRVIAAWIAWVAAQNAFEAKPTAFQKPIFADRLVAILRTRGRKAARRGDNVRQRVLIQANEPEDHCTHTSLPTCCGRLDRQSARLAVSLG